MQKISFMILVVVLTLISCSKEQDTESFRSVILESELKSDSKSGSLNSVTIDGVTKFRDMLWFRDIESFLNSIDLLEEFQEKDIEIFNQRYLTISETELEQYTWEDFENYISDIERKEVEIGFSDVGIFEQFEDKLNFNSLRKKMLDIENQFLNSNDENWDNYPEHEFIALEAEQTVYNVYEEVKIGDKIYKFIEDGYFIVTNGDYSTLLKIRNNISSGFNLENVNFVSNGNGINGKSQSNECRAGKNRKSQYRDPSNTNLRIRWRVGIRSLPNRRFVYARSKNFFKRKRVKAYTKVSVWGQISVDTLCTGPTVFNTLGGSYTEKENVRKRTHKLPVQTFTKSGWVKGYHESRIKGVTIDYISNLTWN